MATVSAGGALQCRDGLGSLIEHAISPLARSYFLAVRLLYAHGRTYFFAATLLHPRLYLHTPHASQKTEAHE